MEIFLVVPPGLEALLCDEARSRGFKSPAIGKGGVTVQGDWREVWRANLELRGASRVIAGIALALISAALCFFTHAARL